MNYRNASDHGYPTKISVSVAKGSTSKGKGRIEISIGSKATAEEFRELLVSTFISDNLLDDVLGVPCRDKQCDKD
jgi:hypothetical protein